MKLKKNIHLILISIFLLTLTGCSEVSQPINSLPESIESIGMFFAIVGVTTLIAISIDFLLNIFLNTNAVIPTLIVMILIIWHKDYGFFAVAGIAILTLVFQLILVRILVFLFSLLMVFISLFTKKR